MAHGTDPLQRWGKWRKFFGNLKLLQLLSQISVLSRISFCICIKSFPLPVGLRCFHDISTHYFVHRPMRHRAMPKAKEDSRSRPCQAFPLLLTTLLDGEGGLFEINWLVSLTNSSMTPQCTTVISLSPVLLVFSHLIFSCISVVVR